MSKYDRKYQVHGHREMVRVVLLEVTGEDAYGNPRECILRWRDDEIIDLEKSSRKFWIIYMTDKAIEDFKRKRKAGTN